MGQLVAALEVGAVDTRQGVRSLRRRDSPLGSRRGVGGLVLGRSSELKRGPP